MPTEAGRQRTPRGGDALLQLTVNGQTFYLGSPARDVRRVEILIVDAMRRRTITWHHLATGEIVLIT
ncbi:hypothetical protein [Protofrankia symbiont of Coriaria ruscifolia]|uniref:hypothetical protein n=1 Tax=Protofrankia symbiont of Coriaria ruscifolia TaxID=1306542 RepID=UPI0010415868|nr:hypothetical protein [Protofrankia symbiont of Coriaria ruscifolia]